MNMLPNDHHPGPRCSCAECLLKYQLAVMAAEQIERQQRDQLVYDDLTRTISSQLDTIERLRAKVADLELIKAGSDKRLLMLINEIEHLRAYIAQGYRKPLGGFVMSLSDGELEKIIQRDAMAGATWFTGPPSFTALAAQDRRALIEDLCALRAERASLEPPTAAPDIAAIRAVIAEMIHVAANGDRDEADWAADNCAQIDAWQVRLAEAVATQEVR